MYTYIALCCLCSKVHHCRMLYLPLLNQWCFEPQTTLNHGAEVTVNEQLMVTSTCNIHKVKCQISDSSITSLSAYRLTNQPHIPRHILRRETESPVGPIRSITLTPKLIPLGLISKLHRAKLNGASANRRSGAEECRASWEVFPNQSWLLNWAWNRRVDVLIRLLMTAEKNSTTEEKLLQEINSERCTVCHELILMKCRALTGTWLLIWLVMCVWRLGSLTLNDDFRFVTRHGTVVCVC